MLLIRLMLATLWFSIQDIIVLETIVFITMVIFDVYWVASIIKNSHSRGQ